MSTDKPTRKPGLWGRLFGGEAKPEPQDRKPDTEPDAHNVGPDAAPPEMQAEWVRAGHPNPPEAEPPVPVDVEVEPEAAPKSWIERLGAGLKRSSDNLTSSIGAVFIKKRLDETTLADLEDTLIAADLGIDTALAITERLRAEKFDKDVSAEDVRLALAEEVASVLAPVATPLEIDAGKKPFVILMVGVNGSGKTTTIGKLTAKFKAAGKSVLLAAGDTFRAAAVEQLQVWGQRNEVEVVTRPTGADASGLAFDAVARAQEEGTDIVIIDTAGRLQNRTELMDELEKIIRVIRKRDETAPHATLLTLDATTGQNALNQVEIFSQKAGVTGLVMTKLDGTARGGILVAIAKKFGLPIHYIGVGEAIGDLESFNADDFARAIAGTGGKD
ncbi:signal recognition particle-docking protein FtsY [Pelagibacterium sediminicola]|uniref:signal recognition particle-docking protein FtsY n=1 Tax=Pelagibacterium sediminicola TaxID=2248761 RepID=UPI000E3198D2|nr:signal recognition particle-docking protein FtsY [Pelagibacterium sediminicola]